MNKIENQSKGAATMEEETKLVVFDSLSKHFGKTKALDNVNLTINHGSIIGLLGANGAGKSTLLRHAIGLYLPTKGYCTTFGTSAAKLGPNELARIGYVHQEGQLLDWMTVGQLLRYVSAYYSTWDKDLEETYLADFDISLKDRVGNLSPGKRQQVAILIGICFAPDLLLLDEPAASMDPLARRKFLNLLLNLIQDKIGTIVISSHILSDVEKVIDHTVIMDKGKIIRDCPFDQLQEEYTRVILTSLNGQLPEDLGFSGIVHCDRDTRRAIITLQNANADDIAAQAQSLNCEYETKPLTLEDIYQHVVS